MIIAAWPVSEDGGVAELLRSAFLGTRSEPIDLWSHESAGGTTTAPPTSDDGLGPSQVLTDVVTTLTSLQGGNHPFPTFAPKLIQAFESINASETELWKRSRALKHAPAWESKDSARVSSRLQVLTDVVTTLRSWQGGNHPFPTFAPKLIQAFESINASETELWKRSRPPIHAPARFELLWWGQARYSPVLRQPYRRIADPELVLWLAAFDSAALIAWADLAPAAAYFIETLVAVGHDASQKRSIREWINSQHAALHEAFGATQEFPKISAKVRRFVASDCTGLPALMIWARYADSGLGDLAVLGLDLDIAIDRGEWATWVLREHMLARALDSAKE
ncbi:MAG: hypothetical protein HY791_22405 [Deltaproteobacteria bacterium]|nr:hypothetical protein [Deltaproteobacteria bacterium]